MNGKIKPRFDRLLQLRPGNRVVTILVESMVISFLSYNHGRKERDGQKKKKGIAQTGKGKK